MNRWSIIDVVFATAVASLPTLNALLPASWRKTTSSTQSPYHATSHPSNSGSDDPSNPYDSEKGIESSSQTSASASESTGSGSTSRPGDEDPNAGSEARRPVPRLWSKKEKNNGDEKWENKSWYGRKGSVVTTIETPKSQQPDWEKYAPGFKI